MGRFLTNFTPVFPLFFPVLCSFDKHDIVRICTIVMHSAYPEANFGRENTLYEERSSCLDQDGNAIEADSVWIHTPLYLINVSIKI